MSMVFSASTPHESIYCFKLLKEKVNGKKKKSMGKYVRGKYDEL